MSINMKKIFAVLFVLILYSFPFVLAAEDGGDILFLNLELEKLLALVNGWISLFLFVVAFVAYRRDKRKRFLFISLAFLLFAIKSFLVASELFISDIAWVDPVATILELAVLLSFFYGVLRK